MVDKLDPEETEDVEPDATEQEKADARVAEIQDVLKDVITDIRAMRDEATLSDDELYEHRMNHYFGNHWGG